MNKTEAKKPLLKAATASAPNGPDLVADTQTNATHPPEKASKIAQSAGFHPPARAAHAQRRHFLLALSFLLCVIVPSFITGIYLYAIAADRYASYVGFSVRKEEVGSAIELLGGISELSGSSSSDTDILHEFLQSQQIVRAINKELNLAEIYLAPQDPIFSLGEDTRIEALHHYWNRMITVVYDSGSGIIKVQVLAFTPEDAQKLAQAIFKESSVMINRLSAIARADATRYAEEELTRMVDRLKKARQAVQEFQIRTRIVDPQADLQGQMGLLNTLNAQLATAQIDLKLLQDKSSEADPRIQQTQRRIAAIERLIEEERKSFSDGDAGTESLSALLAEFQALQVDLEFAEKSYLSAQATYDASVAEAQRQSRYLANHIEPTLAETPEYPQRLILLLTIFAALLVSWSIAVMVYYSLRDRR